MALRRDCCHSLITPENNPIIMPFSVTHMLIPMILLDVLRDNILKIKKKRLPNKYILIAGLAGLLPDIDIPLSFLFGSFFAHRTITHTVWLPLSFLLLSSILYLLKKRDWSLVFLMCFIGTSLHIILDVVTAGSIALLYPVSSTMFSVNLIGTKNVMFVYSIMDAVILWLWFLRMSMKKKIPNIV
jgi:membrane-bound metal-dependent hydrolase YbcI (DUF457 family)